MLADDLQFLGAQELVKRGLTADYAVVAEPTLLNIVTAHKGVVRWVLETAGRACHSSRPENGVNAVYRMARVITAIDRYAAAFRKVFARVDEIVERRDRAALSALLVADDREQRAQLLDGFQRRDAGRRD